MFISLDLETTGFDPRENEIIEIAACRFTEEKILETFDVLVKPTKPLSVEIARLTGLREENFKDAVPLEKAITDFKQFIARTEGNGALVGHNIAFDRMFLEEHGMFEESRTVYDTMELARVLFFNEPSYALDQLMKRFGFSIEQSHRALPDSKNTAVLFQYLVQQARSLPKRTIQKLDSLFQKTDWRYKKFFAPRESTVTTPPPAQENFQTQKHPAAQKLSEGVLAALREKKKLLWENAHIPDLGTLQDSGESLLISYGHFREEFRNFPALHAKEHYFSPEKFEALVQEKEHFEEQEAAFFVKLILFHAMTGTGFRHEIRLHGKEWFLWNIVSGDGLFFEKAKKETSGEPLLLCHHATLATLKNSRKFLILDALSLEENLTAGLQKRFSFDEFDTILAFLSHYPRNEDLRAKLQILFSLLGMYYEENRDEFGNYDLLLDESFESSREGKHFVEALAALQAFWQIIRSSYPAFLQKRFEDFFEVVVSPEKNMARWLSFREGNIILQAAPIKLTPVWQEICGTQENIILMDTALSLKGDFSFFRSLFHLEGFEEKRDRHEEFEKLSFTIPENLPEPNSEGYFQRSAEIIEETLERSSGNLAILFHAKRGLEAHFEKIIERPIASKRHILAVGKTGGQKKVLQQFLENPSGSVLFATSFLFHALETMTPHLQTIVFQKIPFEFSFHPLVKLRQIFFQNGFLTYTLPKALLRLKKFLSHFSLTGDKKEVIFLDQRLLKPEYSVLFKDLQG